jgi:hypothetical protein
MPDLSQFVVPFPTHSVPGPQLRPGAQQPIAPGSYGLTSIGSRATLSLATGTYYFTQIDLEPQATLLLNDSNGPVIIYLRDSAILRGVVASTRGGDPQVRITYLGPGTIQLNAPFSGTVVAPNATIDLTPSNGAVYRGSFFGASVLVDAHSTVTTVVHLPFVP